MTLEMGLGDGLQQHTRVQSMLQFQVSECTKVSRKLKLNHTFHITTQQTMLHSCISHQAQISMCNLLHVSLQLSQPGIPSRVCESAIQALVTLHLAHSTNGLDSTFPLVISYH